MKNRPRYFRMSVQLLAKKGFNRRLLPFYQKCGVVQQLGSMATAWSYFPPHRGKTGQYRKNGGRCFRKRADEKS